MTKTAYQPPRGMFKPEEIVILHILESFTCDCNKAERTFDWEVTALDANIFDHVTNTEDTDIFTFKIKSENIRRFRELYQEGLDIVNRGLVLSKEKADRLVEISQEAIGLLVDPEQHIDWVCFLTIGRRTSLTSGAE